MTSAASHASARATLLDAWGRVFSDEPTLGGLQIAGAVGILESGYGKACYTNKISGVKRCDTNNWGAIQGSKVDASRGMVGGFLQTDFDSTTGKQFEAMYQLYDSPAAGAAHLLQLLAFYAAEEMRDGDIDAFSLALYIGAPRGGTLENPKGYYGGVHTIKGLSGQARIDQAMRNVDDHRKKVEKGANEIALALGEPVEAVRGGGGSSGESPLPISLSLRPLDTLATGAPGTCHPANHPDADELYEPSEK